MKFVDILYFVSDTTMKKKKTDEYYIAIKCAETYGEDFFKKGKKYKLQLNKNFSKIQPYIPSSTLKKFMRQRNFFIATMVVADQMH